MARIISEEDAKSRRYLNIWVGKVIGEHKKRLYRRIMDGMDLEVAMAQFFAELSVACDQIVKIVKPKAGP